MSILVSDDQTHQTLGFSSPTCNAAEAERTSNDIMYHNGPPSAFVSGVVDNCATVSAVPVDEAIPVDLSTSRELLNISILLLE